MFNVSANYDEFGASHPRMF